MRTDRPLAGSGTRARHALRQSRGDDAHPYPHPRQNRANRIKAERRHNRQTRLAAEAFQSAHAPPPNPDEPPPF
ncbi:hypothetical protein [Mycobacterium sp.]|uniref:hypothetical protein n=1 Tax=Mycobacterium sp. TaxID=1785 RepID=UPI003F9B1DCF